MQRRGLRPSKVQHNRPARIVPRTIWARQAQAEVPELQTASRPDTARPANDFDFEENRAIIFVVEALVDRFSQHYQAGFTAIEVACGCSSVVERQLPKLDVMGSNPITRFFCCG